MPENIIQLVTTMEHGWRRERSKVKDGYVSRKRKMRALISLMAYLVILTKFWAIFSFKQTVVYKKLPMLAFYKLAL